MILYTIVPHEEIFAEEHDPEIMEVVRGEMRLVVTASDSGRAQIVRVISTDPGDYLRPEYQPGEYIQLLSGDYQDPIDEGEQES